MSIKMLHTNEAINNGSIKVEARHVVDGVSGALLDRSFLRYLLVGGTSAFIEFQIFNALVYLSALSPVASNIIAITSVTVIGFLSHQAFYFS